MATDPNEAGTGARKRRTYMRAPERRQHIILAAQQVFARTNYQGARTRDIAKAAEVNQATLFEHFESKEALFIEAVVEPMLKAMQGMRERTEAYVAAESLDEMLALGEKSTRNHLEVMVEIFPLLTAALFSEPEIGRKLYREQIMPLLKARSEAIAPLVKEDMDPELVELANFGIFFAVAMDQMFRGKRADLPALAAQVTQLCTLGFLKDRD